MHILFGFKRPEKQYEVLLKDKSFFLQTAQSHEAWTWGRVLHEL